MYTKYLISCVQFFFLVLCYNMSYSEEIFNYCLEELNKKIEGIEINADNIICVLRFAMEVVETTQLKGDAQKEMVVNLVRKVVEVAPISDEKEKLLLDMIDNGILSNTIELVVSASKGEVDVNAVQKVAAGCCLTFLKSKKK